MFPTRSYKNSVSVISRAARQYGSLDAPSATHEIVAVNWDGKRMEWLFGRGKDPSVSFDRTYKVANLLNRLELYQRMLAFLGKYIGPGTTPTQESTQ